MRDYIRKECALEISDDKKYLVESRLMPLMRDCNAKSYDDFYRKIHQDHGLRDKIVHAITTHETLWFRDKSPWRLLEDIILPDLAEQIRTQKKSKIRIWCAACSTGQEPFSIVMLIDQLIQRGILKGTKRNDFEILGTDVSGSAIETARDGIYSELEMKRGMPDNYKQKYFTQLDHGKFQISNAIRNQVKFRVFNLQDNFTGLGNMDLILCRNVLIYFSQEFKKDLMKRLAKLMHENAFLILGSTESGLGHADLFMLKEHHNAIYYKKR